MNRKIILILILFLLPVLNSCNKNKKENQQTVSDIKKKSVLTIDANESKLSWNILRDTGYIAGTIKIAKGTVQMQDGLPASATCIIDINSLTIVNIKDQELNKKITDYLKFKLFEADKYPDAILNIRGIVPLKYAGRPKDNTTIKGYLTIKDSTTQFAVTALNRFYEDRVTSEAIVHFQPSVWDIKLNDPEMDENVKSNPYKDDIEINFFIVAK